jgi:hypothetical protein
MKKITKEMKVVPREHIQKVVDYLAEDEYKHWEESGGTKDHIYLSIVKIQHWLANTAKKPMTRTQYRKFVLGE